MLHFCNSYHVIPARIRMMQQERARQSEEIES
jgi:hypothetical protein